MIGHEEAETAALGFARGAMIGISIEVAVVLVVAWWLS